MGRHRIPPSKRTQPKAISFTLKKIEAATDKYPELKELDLTEELEKMCQREGVDRGTLISKALNLYIAEHRNGNYQTTLTSLAPGAPKSNSQIASIIANKLKSPTVRYREILDQLDINNVRDGDRVKVAEAAERILRQKGAAVWH